MKTPHLRSATVQPETKLRFIFPDFFCSLLVAGVSGFLCKAIRQKLCVDWRRFLDLQRLYPRQIIVRSSFAIHAGQVNLDLGRTRRSVHVLRLTVLDPRVHRPFRARIPSRILA